jgi:putative transposase
MILEHAMYRWRKMTPEDREGGQAAATRSTAVARATALCGGVATVPDHRACYEHRPIIGLSPQRMADFEAEFLEEMRALTSMIFAWVVLPNHYHALVHAADVLALLKRLGLLHGRTSFRWNGEERCRGTTVWHGAAETEMKSERHFWASVNYVLHNPVRHG